MAGRIPRDFIEDLVTRADIVDVIDSRVKLKKAGRNYQACCPFHNEKTPSFSVAPDKQFYYCFGCGAKGNAIGFLMDFERLEFVEAVEELASSLGLEVPREKGSSTSTSTVNKAQRESDYDLMHQVANFYTTQLTQHKNSQQVIDYLKNRGLSGEVVKYWGIGYAPDEWDGVLGNFGKTPKQQDRLLTLKLVNQNEKARRYDFFRHRLMFPILDKRGRVVAFGGRTIDEQGPKYLNSPETRIFHKGYELYGLYQARKENRNLERLLVVEGYMDVVALSQFGISYAVAALGTATTPEHIQMLFKSTSEVICCYDGDNAGRKAAWRALENALPSLKDGVVMKFLFLPDAEDPDSMVRKEGKEAFEKRLTTAMPLSKFFFAHMLERHSTSNIEGKAALKAEAEPLIMQIQGTNQREMLNAELSRLCGESDRYQRQQDDKRAKQYKTDNRSEYQAVKMTLSPVRQMLRLLLDNPKLASIYPQVQPQKLKSLDVPGINMLSELHYYCVNHPESNTALILEAFREHRHAAHLYKLMEHSLPDNAGQEKEYVDCFKTLLRQYLNQRLEKLMEIAESTGLSDVQQEELRLLLAKKANL